MGFLSRILYESLKFFAIIVIISFIPGIPPELEFEAYSVTPPLPLEGPLELNDKLNNAEKLFDGEIKGPEHLEVYNGVLYTTLGGGYVARIEDNNIVPVIKFGQKCDGLHEPEVCGRPLGLSFDSKGFMYVADTYYGIFKVNVTSDGLHEPEVCGRPLGLSFDSKGFMYVADTYYGIFKVNVTSGEYVQLVSMDTVINNKRPKMPNSLAVGSDGSVFWSDSSTSHQLHDGLYIMLGNGNGRLLKYDPVTKNNSVLIDNVLCANGVALSQDNSFVLLSESLKGRILRYHLKGPKKGKSEVFLDGLPGFPDNIHSNGKGEFYTSLVINVDETNAGIAATLGPFPRVRKAILTFLYILELPALQMNLYYPNYFSKVFTHWVGSLAMLPFSMSQRTTIIFFNEDGKIIKSLHSLEKDVTSISDMALYKNMYYLGSFTNPYLLRVKAS